MKDMIIRIREFLLRHFTNNNIRTLIYGLISYEMMSYVFFGIGTSLVDYTIFSSLTAIGCDELISNIISTICAAVFAYITNKLWVFKSKTHGFWDVLQEFLKFANVRFFTLIMTEGHIAHLKTCRWKPIYCKRLAMVLTVILNYILSKLLIFNQRKGTQK